MVKQGRESGNNAGRPYRSPIVHSISPGWAAQLGQKQGSHTTNDGDTGYRGEDMHKGRGFQSPKPKARQHHCGSQGRHEDY